jgi:hypothetical protein
MSATTGGELAGGEHISLTVRHSAKAEVFMLECVKKVSLASVFLGLAGAAAQGATTGHTINVAVGTTIERSLEDAAADGYAYEPKQAYDGAKTKVFLPYGDTDGVYYDLNNMNVLSPAADGTSAGYALPFDGSANSTMDFHLHFDQPISEFALRTRSLTVYGLGPNGVISESYSTDGLTWNPLRVIEGPISTATDYEPFVDATVTGLNTDDLYLRYFATATTGEGNGSYYQLRTVGAGNWGAVDFFDNQSQLTVTAVPEPGSIGLAAVGSVLLLGWRRARIA